MKIKKRHVYEADMEQAGMVEVEGLGRVWWHNVAIPPPATSILEGGPAGVFKGGDNIVGG